MANGFINRMPKKILDFKKDDLLNALQGGTVKCYEEQAYCFQSQLNILLVRHDDILERKGEKCYTCVTTFTS